jgi:polyphosphate kinase 2 (PPK2 family)
MAIDLSDYEAGAAYDGDYDADLARVQERIAHLLVAAILHGKRAIVAIEGWDAAGKGGAIQRLVAKCDPRAFAVHPIAAPTREEKTHHYLWRFWTRLPAAGTVAIFDRTWYGRVLVERVEGLANEAEWRRAYDEINEFEAQLAADGTAIVKLFFHVTQATQDKRLKSRIDHPWKRWKVNAEDFRNRDRRPAYLEAMAEMFAHTDTRWAPWTVIDGNNKKSARIAALTHVADALAAAFPVEPPPMSDELKKLAHKLD